MLRDAALATIAYDLSLGTGLIAVDATLTFFVVDRVIERQEERKRRTLSGLAEARLLEAADGLLADGMPLVSRRLDAKTIDVGTAVVPVQVSAIDKRALEREIHSALFAVLSAVDAALERYATIITNPLNVAVIEPRLSPMLVTLITLVETCREMLPDWRAEPADEVLPEVESTVPKLFHAAWDLSTAIQGRWR